MDAADGEIGVPTERLCRVMELAIADRPLEETLSELIRIVETTSRTGVLGSILLLDGRHLRHGAAPSLPGPYCEAIDGAEIGPVAGSCGTAAFRGKPVFVSDIATDPLWAEYKAVALPHGLRACWSTPIITAGQVARHVCHVPSRAARSDGAGSGAGRSRHPHRGAGHRPQARPGSASAPSLARDRAQSSSSS